MKKLFGFASFPFMAGFFIILFIFLFEKKIVPAVILFSITGTVSICLAVISIFIGKKYWISGIAVLIIMVVYVFFNVYKIYDEYDKSHELMNKDASLLGYISGFPLNKNGRLDFEFTVCGIKKGGRDFAKVRPFRILVKIRSEKEADLLRGDSLIITGEIKLPDKDINGFDYRNYLFYQGINGILSAKPAGIKKINGNGITPAAHIMLKKFVWSFKERLCGSLKKTLTKDNYAFILSIFFGIRSEIDGDIYLEFQNTGMLHLLAISGMNISFIGGIFLFALRFVLSKSKAYIVSLIMLSFYVAAIYYSASGMRAFIMYAICAFYFITGFRTMSFTVLSISALVMIMMNPFCIFDIGFQLSFFATAGIIMFSKIMEEKMPVWLPGRIKSVISVTVSAYLSVIVLQWSLFGKIQVFAVLSSLLMVPLFEFLFVYWFFLLIMFYFVNLDFLAAIIDIPAGIFLKFIHLLNNITPVTLPGIPYFMQFIIFPLIYLCFYQLIPYFSKVIQKTKKSSLIIDFDRKIT